MMDEPYIAEPENKVKINILEEWELAYWSSKLNVPEDELLRMVNFVGPKIRDIKEFIEVLESHKFFLLCSLLNNGLSKI